MAADGPGFIAPRRKRVWGTETALRSIVAACKEVASEFEGTAPIYIGDVSFAKGGYMPPHKSHRDGRDADIGYFFKKNQAKSWFAKPGRGELDGEKTWALLSALIDTGTVEQFYIDHRIQKQLYRAAKRRGHSEKDLKKIFEYPGKRGTGRSKIIRHLRGHADHFHVRFRKVPTPPSS